MRDIDDIKEEEIRLLEKLAELKQEERKIRKEKEKLKYELLDSWDEKSYRKEYEEEYMKSIVVKKRITTTTISMKQVHSSYEEYRKNLEF